MYIGLQLYLFRSQSCRRRHENILSVYFKFPLVKKRWNIFITCQQKMAHLSGTRVSTKKYILKYSRQEYHIYRITAILFPFAVRRCHENIFNVCFKFLLVKKRWYVHLRNLPAKDGASFWHKSIHLQTCRDIYFIMALFCCAYMC